MNDTQLFAFEADFVDSLRCVPMAVRFKLDRCGIKLTLRQWSRFSQQDRQGLLLQACDAPGECGIYRATLVDLIARRAGESARPLAEPAPTQWRDAHRTAAMVRDFAADQGLKPPTDAQWAALSDLQRFVLLKLTRDNHDNVNFVPALREFGLAERLEHRV